MLLGHLHQLLFLLAPGSSSVLDGPKEFPQIYKPTGLTSVTLFHLKGAQVAQKSLYVLYVTVFW